MAENFGAAQNKDLLEKLSSDTGGNYYTPSNARKLSGDVAFKLYDTFGFPLDLTEDALRPRGIGVDKEAFESAMERQRAEARKAWAGSGETATEAVWYALKERVGATEFLGYDAEKSEGVVTALIRDGAQTDWLRAGERGAVIVNQTPFYGESGGQVGDIGELRAKGACFRVEATQKKLGDIIVHEGVVEEGEIALQLHAGDVTDRQLHFLLIQAFRATGAEVEAGRHAAALRAI